MYPPLFTQCWPKAGPLCMGFTKSFQHLARYADEETGSEGQPWASWTTPSLSVLLPGSVTDHALSPLDEHCAFCLGHCSCSVKPEVSSPSLHSILWLSCVGGWGVWADALAKRAELLLGDCSGGWGWGQCGSQLPSARVECGAGAQVGAA